MWGERACVCVCVRHSGIIDLLKVQCVCWIRGAGTGLWACKTLPQLWLLALSVCLSLTHSHTLTHQHAHSYTQIYIWVLLTLSRLSVCAFIYALSVNRWLCADIGGLIWTVRTWLLGKKRWNIQCNLTLSEANESADEWILSPSELSVYSRGCVRLSDCPSLWLTGTKESVIVILFF